MIRAALQLCLFMLFLFAVSILSARQHAVAYRPMLSALYAIARLSVRPSDRQTGGSVENG